MGRGSGGSPRPLGGEWGGSDQGPVVLPRGGSEESHGGSREAFDAEVLGVDRLEGSPRSSDSPSPRHRGRAGSVGAPSSATVTGAEGRSAAWSRGAQMPPSGLLRCLLRRQSGLALYRRRRKNPPATSSAA